MAANRHVLKVAYKATPEAALYGLMNRPGFAGGHFV
jgi:hypothetical protein